MRAPAPKGAGGIRVLVVEDNDINQFVAAEQLEQAGFSVDLAADGAEAVEKVQHHEYAVVLMDVQMPVMDGYAATARFERGKPRVSAVTCRSSPSPPRDGG